MLLEELRLFDNQVYGVAHGLLMGYRENVWLQAQSLFDEVRQMDTSTSSAFYNALTDMLWHFGQVGGSSCCLNNKNSLLENFIILGTICKNQYFSILFVKYFYIYVFICVILSSKGQRHLFPQTETHEIFWRFLLVK